MKRNLLYVIPLTVVFLLTSLVSSFGQSIVHAAPPTVTNRTAAAQTNLTWVNAGTIHITLDVQKVDSGGTPFEFKFDNDFVDGKFFDGHHLYQFSGGSSCTNKSTIKVPYFGATTAAVDIYSPDPGNGNSCNEHLTYSDTVANPIISGAHAGFTAFAWSSATTITMTPEEDSTPVVLTQTVANTKEFKVTGVQGIGLLGDPCSFSGIGSCHDISDADLILSDNNHGKVTLNTYTTRDGTGVSSPPIVNVEIAGSPTAPTAPPPGSTGPASTPSLDCNVSILNPLTWLICPIEAGMAGIVSGLDSQINDMLSVGTPAPPGGAARTDQPSTIFCTGAQTGTCGDYFDAWQEFRNIALGLMAIAGLIVVISQALGMEILDAYAIRKMLPRLLIAALAITLSWQLMRFAVTLTNDLGYGMKQLIDTPFHGIQGSFDLGGGNGLGTSIVGSIALTSLGIFGLLSFAGTAAIAVFIAFLTLIIRQLVIVMLIIVSPIAIVAYILPNTQKTYKLWWESFSKALLMFPLIVAFIELGRVFAVLELQPSAAGSGGFLGGTVQQFVGFFAYFAPYFMIPATFRFAGAAMGGIGNAINSRGEGARNALKGYRGNVAKKNWQDLKTGNRLKGEDIKALGYGRFAKRFNRGTKAIANAPEAGYNPYRMRQRYRDAQSTQTTNEAMEALDKNDKLRDIKTDDDAVEAALKYDNDEDVEAYLMSKGLTKERATQTTAGIRAARRSMSAPAFDKAMLMASGGTSSGWTSEFAVDANGDYIHEDANGKVVSADTAGARRRLIKGEEGAGAARSMINKKLGNDRKGAIAVLGTFRQQAESKGRFDLVGGSFTEDAKMLERAYAGGNSAKQMSASEITHQVHRNALEGQSRAKLANGHNRSMEALAPEMSEQLNEAVYHGTGEDAGAQYAFMADSLDYASGSAPEMARHIKQKVLDKKVDVSQMSPDAAQYLNNKGVRLFDAGNKPRTDLSQAEVMEQLRKDPEIFARYRREYSSGAIGDYEGRIHGG
jgi:hypothetical protein